jgi:hypothetical protein
MYATLIFDLYTRRLPIARKRLLDEYAGLERGGWRELARRRGINFRYVYEFAIYGKLPQNRQIRKLLLSGPPVVRDEPTRYVLTGAWKLHGHWVGPEEYFGARS